MPRGRSKNHARSQASLHSSPMQLRRVAISVLKPAPYNPRVDLTPGHPTFEKLHRSIDTFGTVEPIVWNRRTGHVVGGQAPTADAASPKHSRPRASGHGAQGHHAHET